MGTNGNLGGDYAEYEFAPLRSLAAASGISVTTGAHTRCSNPPTTVPPGAAGPGWPQRVVGRWRPAVESIGGRSRPHARRWFRGGLVRDRVTAAGNAGGTDARRSGPDERDAIVPEWVWREGRRSPLVRSPPRSFCGSVGVSASSTGSRTRRRAVATFPRRVGRRSTGHRRLGRHQRRRARSSRRERVEGVAATTCSLWGAASIYTSLVPLTLELSDEVMSRLVAVAVARGVSVEELAAQTLAQVPAVDAEFVSLVSETIAEHRVILDRLANT